ncbi:hypothetical protein SISSUDRAFT_1111916 [Sistotremastrum suecicum HHB10207 ss-3]|uniref:Uncharacterized protein n=1 Tax=Sistotremastrum suecicum HHB10207 ss-3 TaxID=1314776 RepID=A0A166IKM2_9AGAM|nr:hypothetical protein SISSUDRAFT_1111916 [Sistotremastrum suecicum HHB10207 ss-3]
MSNDCGGLLDALRNAYARLTHDQLVLFCSLRALATTGDLVSLLANHDIHAYSPASLALSACPPPAHSDTPKPDSTPRIRPRMQQLPVEIIAEILDHLGDWELSKSVGLPTSLHPPSEWTRATEVDHAILTGYLPLVRTHALTQVPFTRIGAKIILRFGFVHILEYLRTQHRSNFEKEFGKHAELVPTKASLYGRTNLLFWWKNCTESGPKVYDHEAMDLASKAGAVNALHWWHQHSGLPLLYSEAALDGASMKGHIAVLDWWKASGLPLKIGRVMDAASVAGDTSVLDWWASSGIEMKYDKQPLYSASCHGKVSVLQWWLHSGLQMIYDSDVLVGATRHNRPSVLEWWDKTGLPVPYRICDIEEALEDAIGGGEEARSWWRQKGVDFHAGDAEWMKTQTLN